MSKECAVHCWHVDPLPKSGGKERVSCCGCKRSETRAPLYAPPDPPKAK